MILNCIVTILDKDHLRDFMAVCRAAETPLVLTSLGRGTAEEKYLTLYELEATQKAVVISIASEEQTKKLQREARRRLLMDVPGNGIMLTVPVKSIAGASLDYLSLKDAKTEGASTMPFEYELILSILNRGYVDEVVAAARSAGAGGGTIIHAVGALAKEASTFLGMQISSEKDILLIASESGKKAGIMRSISEKFSENEEISGIVLSVPVSNAIGLRSFESDA